MKLTTAVSICFLTLALMHLHLGVSIARVDSTLQEIQTDTVFSYHVGPGDLLHTSRALALFGAKYKAVLLSADRLNDRGLLKDYADKQMEVFCLVADELQPRIIDESLSKNSRIYKVRIASRLSLADFVKAEIRNAVLEKEEMHFSLQEEMEPTVSPTIAPAQELSRAYRYIEKHHWRMAVIYLDHLEKKYPHWGALFFAKANAFLGMHQTEKAISALSAACYLGEEKACLKLDELDLPEP